MLRDVAAVLALGLIADAIVQRRLLWLRLQIRKRSWNDSSLSGYLSDFSGGHEYLTDSQMAMERIMLSLRTDRGISEKFLRQHSRLGAVDAALEAGWLVPCPEGLRIPEDHFFVSDNIISDLV